MSYYRINSWYLVLFLLSKTAIVPKHHKGRIKSEYEQEIWTNYRNQYDLSNPENQDRRIISSFLLYYLVSNSLQSTNFKCRKKIKMPQSGSVFFYLATYSWCLIFFNGFMKEGLFPCFSLPGVLCDPTDLICRKGTQFEEMPGRTAPSSDGLLAEVFWGFPQL